MYWEVSHTNITNLNLITPNRSEQPAERNSSQDGVTSASMGQPHSVRRVWQPDITSRTNNCNAYMLGLHLQQEPNWRAWSTSAWTKFYSDPQVKQQLHGTYGMPDRLLTVMIKEWNDGALNLFWNVVLPVGVSVPHLKLDKADKNAHVLEVSLQPRSPYTHSLTR
jgi:hypothetical protein